MLDILLQIEGDIMNQNQKAVRVFIDYNGLRTVNTSKIADKYKVDKRLLSYLSSLKDITSSEEFTKICENVLEGKAVAVTSGESTKSLECLLKIIRKTNSRVLLVDAPVVTMVVYILTSEDKTKIGVAKSITNRIKLLQTGNPYILKLEAVYRTTEPLARKIEKELHLKYKEYKCVGEWFTLPDSHKKSLIKFINEGLNDGK